MTNREVGKTVRDIGRVTRRILWSEDKIHLLLKAYGCRRNAHYPLEGRLHLMRIRRRALHFASFQCHSLVCGQGKSKRRRATIAASKLRISLSSLGHDGLGTSAGNQIGNEAASTTMIVPTQSPLLTTKLGRGSAQRSPSVQASRCQ